MQLVDITQGVFSSVQESRKSLFTLPQCFELFGLDFVVSDDWNAWLLEVNSSPDVSLFEQKYRHLARRVVEGVVTLALDPLFPPHAKLRKTEHEDGFRFVFQMSEPI